MRPHFKRFNKRGIEKGRKQIKVKAEFFSFLRSSLADWRHIITVIKHKWERCTTQDFQVTSYDHKAPEKLCHKRQHVGCRPLLDVWPCSGQCGYSKCCNSFLWIAVPWFILPSLEWRLNAAMKQRVPRKKKNTKRLQTEQHNFQEKCFKHLIYLTWILGRFIYPAKLTQTVCLYDRFTK